MATRGRPKKNLEEKIRNGTHRADRDGVKPGQSKKQAEYTKTGKLRVVPKKAITKPLKPPKVEAPEIKPPERLDASMHTEWRMLFDKLTANGYWDEYMASVIESRCIERFFYLKAVKEMADAGGTNYSQNGQPHPNTIINNKLMNISRIDKDYRIAEKLASPAQANEGETEEEKKLKSLFG